MKKLLTVIIVCLCVVAMIAGCEGGTTTTGQTTTKSGETSTEATTTIAKAETINFFNSVGAYKILLEEKVADWNETVGKEKGVTIVMDTNIDNYQDALKMLIEAGNSPDIYCGASISHIKSGWVMPLNDVTEVQEVLAVYQDSLVNGVNVVDGQIYSTPECWYPIKFAYNKDLFIKSGIVDDKGEAKPPKTIDELVEYAKIITENGNGKEFGYGFTNGWSPYCARRFILKSFEMSTGVSWFNNSENKYDFAPFKPMFAAVQQMFADGSVFPGYETISIDAIRAQFAEGNIGMMCAPSYDIGVYVNQFPAQCDWGVCDPPQLTEDPKYKGVCFVWNGPVISSTVSADRIWAAAEVWNFFNSVEFRAELYATGNIVPTAVEILNYANENCEFVDMKNWEIMGDITNYTAQPNYPDTLLVLEGDDYQTTFQRVVLGEMTLDEMVEDLNTRYNNAYNQGIEDGTIDESIYHYVPNVNR